MNVNLKIKERLRMELRKILSGLERLKTRGNLDIDIKNIAFDSNKVKDRIFVCCS